MFKSMQKTFNSLNKAPAPDSVTFVLLFYRYKKTLIDEGFFTQKKQKERFVQDGCKDKILSHLPSCSTRTKLSKTIIYLISGG